jgi:hypothetical protein
MPSLAPFGQAVSEEKIFLTLANQKKERAKTAWLGIRIMCASGATCLPTDCCFSELAL